MISALCRPFRPGGWGKRGLTEATRITRGRPRFYTGSRYVPPNRTQVKGNGVNAYQVGEVVTTIPTIGFNVESVTYKNLNFNVWVRARHHPPLSPCTL